MNDRQSGFRVGRTESGLQARFHFFAPNPVTQDELPSAMLPTGFGRALEVGRADTLLGSSPTAKDTFCDTKSGLIQLTMLVDCCLEQILIFQYLS